MSMLVSGSLSPAAGASVAPEVEGHWAPHGAILTACVVGINLLVILLIFGFFWRFFSGKGGPSTSGGADDDDDSLPVASPWAASRHRHEGHGAQSRPVEDVAASLPVSVYDSSAGAGAEEGGKDPECAVCIVELRDGDSVGVLPRCGHRFHADCVGAWLRLHTTCPLCRGRVVWLPPPRPSLTSPGTLRTTTTTTSPRIVPCETALRPTPRTDRLLDVAVHGDQASGGPRTWRKVTTI